MKLYIAIGLLAVNRGTVAHLDLSHQWALQYLKATDAWHLSMGAGITTAVVDSGVAKNPDLENRLLAGADFSNGLDWPTGSEPDDSGLDGHGTGMATLIAGSGRGDHSTTGLAPASYILPIRAFLGSPSGLSYGLAPAISYATAHGAEVINLSVVEPAATASVKESIKAALAHDVVVVAAVGNGGDSRQYYPAAYPGVLGVGAIDRNGNVWSQSNTGADVGLVAPGVDIYRDDNQGRQGYSDGTSEATAYVSAAAALVRSAHPTWTGPQVVAALIATADKPAAMHGAVRTDQYGYGILDVLAALRLSEPPPVGVTTSPDPVKTAAGSQEAVEGRSGGQSGLVFGVVGGAVAVLVAGLGALGLARRRAMRRSRG